MIFNKKVWYVSLLLTSSLLLCSCKNTAKDSGNASFNSYIEQMSSEIQKMNQTSELTIDAAKENAYLKKLSSFDSSSLTGSQLHTRNVLIDFLKRDIAMQDAKKKQNGVKNGKKKYYSALLSKRVGTDLTPEEAISLLEEEVKETKESIDTLLKTNEDLALDYTSALPVLSDPEEIVQELESDSKIYFPSIQAVDYQIEEMPEALSTNDTIASYMRPSISEEETNIIYINSIRVGSDELFPTLAHETYPGHLYQTNYALQQELPTVRYLFTSEGYEEGWAVYAQMSSYEFLEFQDVDASTQKNLQTLSKENAILNTYLLSLSDLYVNYTGYKEEQLAKYLSDYNIDSEQAAIIYDYVKENVCTYPTYGLGYYEFTQLEENARNSLGDDFDIKDFRTKILDAGECSFAILKKLIK